MGGENSCGRCTFCGNDSNNKRWKCTVKLCAMICIWPHSNYWWQIENRIVTLLLLFYLRCFYLFILILNCDRRSKRQIEKWNSYQFRFLNYLQFFRFFFCFFFVYNFQCEAGGWTINNIMKYVIIKRKTKYNYMQIFGSTQMLTDRFECSYT